MKAKRKVFKVLCVLVIALLMAITTISFNTNEVSASGEYSLEFFFGLGKTNGTNQTNADIFTGSGAMLNNVSAYSIKGYRDTAYTNGPSSGMGNRYDNSYTGIKSVDVWYKGAKATLSPTGTLYYTSTGITSSSSGATKLTTFAKSGSSLCTRWFAIPGEVDVVVHYTSGEHTITVNNIDDASFDNDLGEKYDRYYTTKSLDSTSTIVSSNYTNSNGIVQDITLGSTNAVGNVIVQIGSDEIACNTAVGIQYLSSSLSFSNSHASGDILAIDFDSNQIIYYKVNNDINITYNYVTNVTYDVTFMANDDVYDSQEVFEGYYASKPEDPEIPSGYNAFVGWYLNDEEFDFNTKINSDLILQARFALLDEFNVTFMKGENVYEEQIILDGHTATKPTDPLIPSGYDVFIGWYLNDEEFDFSTIIDEDITLYAKFDVYHTVTFKNLGHDYTSSNGSLLNANFIASGSWASETGGVMDFHNCVGTTVGDYISSTGLALNGYTLLYDFEKLTMKFGGHQTLTIDGLSNLKGKTYFVDENYQLVERKDYQEGDIFKISTNATTTSTINTRFYKIVENIEFELFYTNYHTIRILNFGNGSHGSIGVGKFASSGADYSFYAWDPYGSAYGGGTNLKNGGTIDYNAGIATIYGDYSSDKGYGAALLIYEDYEKHDKITFTYGEDTITYDLDNTKYTNETWYVDGIKVLVFVQNTGTSYYNLRFFNVAGDITVKTSKDIGATASADVTLNNDGTLTEKIYAQIPDYKEGYSVTIDGQETSVSLIDSSTFRYKIDTPAKAPSKINESFTIRIVDETNEELYSKTTSLKEYLYALIDAEGSLAVMKNLAKSMLNFGAYCQMYFNETDDGLANEDLPLEEQDVDEVVINPTNARVISGSTDGISFYGQSLNLISATKLCIYFQIEDGNINEYVFKDGANVLTPSKYSDNIYFVSIRNVAAPDLGVKHAFSVTRGGEGDLTVTASVLSYANVVINKYEDATDEEHINLVKAMKALYAYEAAATNAGILPTVSGLLYTNKTVESVKLGDPFIVYDNRENGTGKFYCYGTTGQLGAKGFYAYESSDLENWGNPKTVFKRDDTTWCQSTLWAPEVIYDEETELYYMFYSAKWEAAAQDNPGEDDYYYLYGSVATCAEPNGTFVEYSSENKSTYEPLICFEKHNDEIPVSLRSTLSGIDGKTGFIKIIDASPFVDPVSGKKYLYFVADTNTPYSNGSFIMGMEMEDWVTPKYETLTKLTSIGFTTVGGFGLISEGQRINEGPSVYYHNGTYYLTFSTYSYKNVKYQVRQALATSPLGAYTKIQPANGGTVISTADYMISQSAGHSSFLQLGDELYIVYHAFYNDTDVDDGRRIAVDKLTFVDNGVGQEVLKAAGPTTTPQPKPEVLTGYRNLAAEATITSNVSGNLGYLNDGFLPLDESGYEYIVSSGKVTITINLDSYREVRGLLIYNARDEENRFSQISSISIYGLNETETFIDLVYDNSEYTRNEKEALDAALILSLNEKGVSTITITFNEDHQIALPEIIVLGK